MERKLKKGKRHRELAAGPNEKKRENLISLKTDIKGKIYMLPRNSVQKGPSKVGTRELMRVSLANR